METHETHSFDLIEFYAGGLIPHRNLELIKSRIEKKVTRQKDPELKPYVSFREALRELQTLYLKRHDRHTLDHSDTHPILKELLQLKPDDLFIMLAQSRYQISDADLSIILHMSADHIQFRRLQLIDLMGKPDSNALQSMVKAPLSKIADETQERRKQPKNLIDRFRSLPLPARFLFETAIVLSVLIFLMWLIPEMRNRYENSIQKRINDYLIESSITDAPAPEGTSKSPRIVTQPPEESNLNNETESEPEEKLIETQSKKPLKVNDGETWRFSFTGPSTNDIVSEITNTVKKSGVDAKSITVPGGIQFDFYLSTKELANLKLNLEQMTRELQRHSRSSSSDAPAPTNMSWYKKKNMQGRKIPAGQVEVVIWVSTL